MVRVYYGSEAVREVEKREGKLTPAQKRVVREEGFVDGLYKDTKGIVTSGVGQVGEFINKGFKASYEEHVNRTRGMTKDFDKLPDYLKEELIQSTYRGDWSGSPMTRDIFNSGGYKAAAREFLNHEEYLKPDTPQHIKDRIKSVSDALLRYAEEAK